MQYRKALEAIAARIKGEWDNPSLMEFGELMPDTNEDLLRFAEEALAATEDLYMLTIKAPEGKQVFVLSSNGKAKDALDEYVEANWDTLLTKRPMTDYDSPIEYYFRHKKEESFSVHKCYLDDVKINPVLKNDPVGTLKV